MSEVAFTDADFARALANLLPRGRVWNTDSDSVQSKAVSAYAPTFRRNSDAGLELLVDAFPSTTVGLLPEWEYTLGLPDPCAGTAPTLQTRRAQVVARFSSTGGQSVSDFVAYAAGLGYAITVKQYMPFRVGQAACGMPLGGEEWAHTWAVETTANTPTYMRVGSSRVGEPLASWGDEVLECELTEISPAHSILQFHYDT